MWDPVILTRSIEANSSMKLLANIKPDVATTAWAFASTATCSCRILTHVSCVCTAFQMSLDALVEEDNVDVVALGGLKPTKILFHL